MTAVDTRVAPQLRRWAGAGLAVAVTVALAAMAVPAVVGWDVHVRSFPPLHAEWVPRTGPGSVAAVLLAAAAVWWLPRWCRAARWPVLLVGSAVASLAWMVALATVDGWDGIGVILESEYEYLGPARAVTDVHATLEEYVDRIPYERPDRWPPHVAGHPPGALLFFVALVRLGLGGGLAAGLVVTLIAATVPAAVLVTLRLLGAEVAARSVAPFLVVGPAALWMAVSADAVFAAVGAWGIAALAAAATSPRAAGVAGWGLLAGALLGYCVMMSYGLPLLGLLAVAVLIAAGNGRPLPWAAGSAVGVVLFFGVAGGFWWWEAFPVLRERYWDGVARNRPPTYWLWGNLAAFAIAAGPMVGAAIGAILGGLRHAGVGVLLPPRDAETGVVRHPERVVLLLGGAAVAMVIVADASLMSMAEVERIWLPFVPWALLGIALLPQSWLRRGLAVQAGVALVVQHLLVTGW
jgi:hypothetical protein